MCGVSRSWCRLLLQRRPALLTWVRQEKWEQYGRFHSRATVLLTSPSEPLLPAPGRALGTRAWTWLHLAVGVVLMRDMSTKKSSRKASPASNFSAVVCRSLRLTQRSVSLLRLDDFLTQNKSVLKRAAARVLEHKQVQAWRAVFWPKTEKRGQCPCCFRQQSRWYFKQHTQTEWLYFHWTLINHLIALAQ